MIMGKRWTEDYNIEPRSPIGPLDAVVVAEILGHYSNLHKIAEEDIHQRMGLKSMGILDGKDADYYCFNE